MNELVVLVDEVNNVIGTADKNTVHTKNTPLHRGFSVFIFNSKKLLLLTRRALTKKTFPGVWTNTVCGHPRPNENVVAAAKRRLKAELGLEIEDIKEVSPYRYRFTDQNGIVENEICPVLIGYTDTDPQPVSSEISFWKWMEWEKFVQEITSNPQGYSPWCREEAKLITNVI